MESKPESDIADILVRVWGMADGHAFFQNAYARKLSSAGALLADIEHPLHPDDVVGVQYGDKKARFRVLQVSESTLPQRIHAQVQLMEGQHCPWEQHLSPGQKTIAASGHNKRQFPRYKTHFPLELRANRTGGGPMQTNSADISGRGCYVETLVPLPLGTNLNIVLWIESDKISTTGIVRSSDPGVGMGIEFTGLDLQTKERLQEFLSKLTGQPANAEGAT
jgi:hypothetical protein